MRMEPQQQDLFPVERVEPVCVITVVDDGIEAQWSTTTYPVLFPNWATALAVVLHPVNLRNGVQLRVRADARA